MFSKIVVGTDGSEMSEKALRAACDIAAKYDAEIHLVHTPQIQTVAFALGAVAGYHAVTTMPSPEEVQQAADKVIETARGIVEQSGRSVASTRVNLGDPADEVVACAEENGADLIVTGRRGLGSVGALVQGSTSLKIGHNAKCACLTVV